MANIIVIGAGGTGGQTLQLLPKNRHVTAIDRDFVDLATLGRQTLYTERDLGRLKAGVAEEKLGIRGISEHLNPKNAAALLKGADIVVDCTDNWETRCVINEWALKSKKPWVFTSAIKKEAMLTTITPKTACFVCWNPRPKKPRSCSEEGITLETTATIAKEAAKEANRLLQNRPKYAGLLLYIDLQNGIRTAKPLLQNPDCSACVKKTFKLPKHKTATLCGGSEFLFETLAKPDGKKLTSLKPERIGSTIKIKWKGGLVFVLPNGRIITKGLNRREAERAAAMLAQKLQS